MEERKKKKIMNSRQDLLSNNNRALRDGIELEKGATLTSEWLRQHEEFLRSQVEFFSAYPDLYLDCIKPSDSDFSLFFYQRIVLRATMRFKDIFVTAPRAFSKSFLFILGFMLQCIFIPGRKVFICANTKQQAAQITKEKVYEIFDHWPLLRKEVIGHELKAYPGNYGKDYVQLRFRNGSILDVVLAGDAARGGRRHGGLIDEIRDGDEGAINNVVLPLVNVSRRMADNTVNDKEPNQQIVAATSAGAKTSFAYDRLIDTFENSIIDPEHAFVFGCDWRVPALHGLIDKQFINKLKMSPSYNEVSFATEYLSLWQGSSEESWFNYDKLTKYRKLKNPETQFHRGQYSHFYLLSVDVGRLNDSTVCCVFKVKENKQGFQCSLVNMYMLGRTAETKPFSVQARDLKKIARAFDAREIVVDTNGLGVGLADELIKTQYDENGDELGPLGFINDDSYLKIQPKDAPKVLYGIKANNQLNSKINSNCYSRIHSGTVKFLISEQAAKSELLATKTGQRMSVEKRVIRLMPHENTTKLFDEMSNLRLKRTGAGLDITLERINSRFPKDRYSAFSYGLWRIKELEDEYLKKKRRRAAFSSRQLVFFTGGE